MTKKQRLKGWIIGLGALMWLLVATDVEAGYSQRIERGGRGHPGPPASRIALYRQRDAWRPATVVHAGDRVRFDLAITQPGFYSPTATILVQQQGQSFALPPRRGLYFYKHSMRRVGASPGGHFRFTITLSVPAKGWVGHDVARFAVTNGRIVDGASFKFKVC